MATAATLPWPAADRRVAGSGQSGRALLGCSRLALPTQVVTSAEREQHDPGGERTAPSTGDDTGDQTAAARAAERFRIFERIALERLRAGADVTRPAQLLPLPMRVTTLVAAAISLAGLLWACLAEVPVQVNGTAVIVPESLPSGLNAPVSGILHFQVGGRSGASLPETKRRINRDLSRYWTQQAIRLTTDTPDVSSIERLVHMALQPQSGIPLILEGVGQAQLTYDQPQATSGRDDRMDHFSFGTILASLESPTAHVRLNSALLVSLRAERLEREAIQQGKRRASQYNAMVQLQGGQRQQIAAELRTRLSLQDRYRVLVAQGALSEIAMLDEKTRLNALRAQLLTSHREEMSTRLLGEDQLNASEKAALASNSIRNSLEDALIAYLSDTRLFIPEPGAYILAVNFENGSRVNKGDEVVSYTTEPPRLPRVVPLFLTAASAQQVDEGMKVLITPRGISRAQYGGIPGVVTNVVQLPLPPDGVLGAVGSRSLATRIQSTIPSPYLVRVRLEQAQPHYCRQALSRRCYRWSSGRLPPHPVRLATLADAQITTLHRRPVEFVLPALRRGLGLVVDNR